MRVAPPGALITGMDRGVDAPVFHPTQLANLHGWFDATQESLTNGTAVSTLTDRAPTPHNLTQVTGANQPLGQTGANGINGRQAILFDGVNDYLTTALSAFTLFSTATVCCAVRTGSDVTGVHDVLTTVNNAGTAQVGFFLQAGFWGLQSTATVFGSAAAINTNYRVIFNYNGASSSIVVNGTTTSGLNPGATDIASYRMGADIGVGGLWNGLQGEVFVYNRSLSTTEIALVDLYLSRKWGI